MRASGRRVSNSVFIPSMPTYSRSFDNSDYDVFLPHSAYCTPVRTCPRMQTFYALPTQAHLGLVGEKCNVDFCQSFDDFGCSRFHQLIKQGIWTSCKKDKRQRVSPSTCRSISTVAHIWGIFYFIRILRRQLESSSHPRLSLISRVQKEG